MVNQKVLCRVYDRNMAVVEATWQSFFYNSYAPGNKLCTLAADEKYMKVDVSIETTTKVVMWLS